MSWQFLQNLPSYLQVIALDTVYIGICNVKALCPSGVISVISFQILFKLGVKVYSNDVSASKSLFHWVLYSFQWQKYQNKKKSWRD